MSRKPLIVIDPGHGGADPGAISPISGVREADLNLLLARAFVEASQGGPYETLTLRSTDTYLTLEDRARLANEAKADAVLSFHCNAASSPEADGFEIWTSPGETAADRLATLLYLELMNETPMFGRSDYEDRDPDKEANFYILRHTLSPAVLLEFGFLTNPEDAGYLTDPDGRADCIRGVKSAVMQWLEERGLICRL